jgi:hypothetical protein
MKSSNESRGISENGRRDNRPDALSVGFWHGVEAAAAASFSVGSRNTENTETEKKSRNAERKQCSSFGSPKNPKKSQVSHLTSGHNEKHFRGFYSKDQQQQSVNLLGVLFSRDPSKALISRRSRDFSGSGEIDMI